MKLPRYPKYKDSGVKWLGQVPEHWSIFAIKRLADLRSGESIDSENIDAEGTFPVYGGNGLRGYTNRFTHHGQLVLIGRQGALCGNVNYASGKFWASEHAIVTSPKVSYDTTWLGELMRAMNLNQYSLSAAQPGLSADFIRNLTIPVPPPEEQNHIGRFLCDETGKTDVLIAEQQRLIELLKEKRQAIISHAVTKGLNSDARIKPSGIDWIDAVPSNWKILKLKYLIKKIEQGWSPQCENSPAEEDEWSVLKVGCVNGGRFNPLENKGLPHNLEPEPKLGIRKEDVLISRANTRELVGSAAVALSSYPKHMLCDKLYRLTIRRGECNPHYVALFLSTPSARSGIELSATGASQSMVNIAQSVITDMAFPVPPLDEQQKIVEHIAYENRKLDSLINKALQTITLLQERRSALISAAVTGQIDVRNYRPQEAHPECQ